MLNQIRYYEWICDDCGVKVIQSSSQYPDGWEEVDDNPKGECQDVCEKCAVNHTIF